MAFRIKSITILDSTGSVPINRFTDILGMKVDKLNARVEIEATTEPIPAEIPVEVRILEPTLRRHDMSSMKGFLPAKAQRQGGTLRYLATVPLSSLGKFMTAGDSLSEVATVVRDGGTSSMLFRSKLARGGWAIRGAGKQAAEGKPDVTGDVLEQQPDAKTLFLSGGVEVIEVSVPASPAFKVGPQATTWAFIRSPADVFFYSGHGGWWNCNLLRDDHASGATTGYPLWLSPETLLDFWKKQTDITTSPMDLDVLIINGCSVLGDFGPSTEGEAVEGAKTKPSCALRWQDLLTSRKGPLIAILGYRDTAPLDSGGGDQIALEMAQAMLDTLGEKWNDYARKWLDINAKYPQTRTAAAIDNAGYSYINQKMAPASHTHEERMMTGYNPKMAEGAVIGPGPVPTYDRTWYKITDQSLAALRKKHVPDAVLSKLAPLKDTELRFMDFMKKLVDLFSKDEQDKFLQQILNQAYTRGV
jgi:hypothetical protein